MNNQQKTYAILPNVDVRAMEGVISSLGKKGIPIVGLSTKENCCAFNSKYIIKKLISPPTTDESNFIDYLISRVPKGILFTSDDQTTLLFSNHAQTLKENGFLTNIPDYETLKTGFDKWLCYLKASHIGIPCARTQLIKHSKDISHVKATMTYPFILKATTLAGGNYVKVNNENEVEDAFAQMEKIIANTCESILKPQIIAQEWLEYEMEDIWCLEAYYDQKSTPRGFMPVKKTRTVIKKNGTYGSRLYAGESKENKMLTQLSKKLLDSLNWKGFAHFDWIYSKTKKKYFLTEINPRLPGFSFFPSKAGFEMAYFYYSDLAGVPFDVSQLKPTLYFETLRYPGDLSSSFATIARNQYSLAKMLHSYLEIIKQRKAFVVDFFDTDDINMTLANIKKIIRTTLSEIA